MVITLDGPSGTGKSTLAKMLAKELKFKFLNTGMIYRTIAYFLLTHNILPQDKDAVSEVVGSLEVEIKHNNDDQFVIINNVDCTPFVSSTIVQQNVSFYSQIPALRGVVLKLQRNFAKTNNIVIEGRDIGTEVFPNAEFKFYIDCDIKIRAIRRFNDLQKGNSNITLKEVEKSLQNRDYLDKTREISPLVMPKDAIVIDTSNKSADESLNEILSFINNRR